MAEDEFTLDDMRAMAAEIGMTRLSEEHLQQLLRATKAARARRTVQAFAQLTPADEPAHVYFLAQGEEA